MKSINHSGSLKGFTIIELIVVIAIIAVLASIVLNNVSRYQLKAKYARAEADASNIEKALSAFYAQYGDYPCNSSSPCDSFFSFSTGPSTEPYLTVNGENRPLSEFYNSDYTANYFSPGSYYTVSLGDYNGGKCGLIQLYGAVGTGIFYGRQYILDCKELNVDNSDSFVSHQQL